MKGMKGWIGFLLGPQRAERRAAKQFAAYRWTGKTVRADAVKDISSTGVYILTEERRSLDTLMAVTLQKAGPLEKSPEHRITALARVARCGDDGMGLSFVASKDPDSREWENLLENLVEQIKPGDMLSLVRLAEAMGFLSQLCPGGAISVGKLFHKSLSNHTAGNAIGILLGAEALLGSKPITPGMKASERLVVRILEDGSSTDEEWLQKFWGGLLLASCSVDGKDESNLPYVNLFSELTSIPIRIFTVVCTRATKMISEAGAISAKPLACKIEEIMVITGSREHQVERDIERLAGLGLLERKSVKGAPALLPSDEALITPSPLGLQLFARCNGHVGAAQDFYGLDAPAAVVGANQGS